MTTQLAEKAEVYLRRLCVDITARHTGSASNRAATDFFAATVAGFGFTVETPRFDCIDWVESGADLAVDGAAFQVKASPFTLGCAARAPLVVVSTVAELEAADIAGRFDDILLGINVDDVGYRKGRAAYSLYDCPAKIDGAARAVFAGYPGLVEGPLWYQGDHSILLLNQVPAVALTAEELAELMAEITHTPRDTVDIVDPARLVEVAQALYNLLQRLSEVCRNPRLEKRNP